MELTRQQIEDISVFAGLELTADELEQFTCRINELLDQTALLQEVDTAGVEPTSHVSPMTNVFREDEVMQSLSPDKVVANSPQVRENCFVVPRVVES